MATVLVVDDEPIVREVVVRYLTREGHRTLEAADGIAARDVIEDADLDLVVLDLMLPGTDGLELCRWIRGRSELPVIMLTARGEEADRIVGLELGADDYVTKPFSAREVAARIRAVLRRVEDAPGDAPAAGRLSVGELVLDPAGRTASFAGEPLELSRKEFEVLELLAREAGRVVTRERLLEEVWETTWFGSTKTLDVHVSGIRRKLGDDPSAPRYLHTVRGVGFRLEEPS
jgi:DNA-binding response OmpR family regulator